MLSYGWFIFRRVNLAGLLVYCGGGYMCGTSFLYSDNKSCTYVYGERLCNSELNFFDTRPSFLSSSVVSNILGCLLEKSAIMSAARLYRNWSFG